VATCWVCICARPHPRTHAHTPTAKVQLSHNLKQKAHTYSQLVTFAAVYQSVPNMLSTNTIIYTMVYMTDDVGFVGIKPN